MNEPQEMPFNTFCDLIKTLLTAYIQANPNSPFKNGKVLVTDNFGGKDFGFTAISIFLENTERMATPFLNLESMYEDYLIDNVDPISFVINIYQSCYNVYTKVSDLNIFDFHYMRSRLFVQVTSIEDAPEDSPWMQVDDLVLSCMLMLPDLGDGPGIVAATNVSNQLVKEWGLTDMALFKIAFSNSASLFPVQFSNLNDVYFKDTEMEDRLPPFIKITSPDDAPSGAAALFYPGVMKLVSDKFFDGESYFLIPASKREFIAVPDTCDVRDLNEFIDTVSMTEIPPELWLSTHAYQWTPEDGFSTADDPSLFGGL